MNRLAVLAAGVVLSCVTTVAARQPQWEQLTSKEAKFSVLLPGKAKEKTKVDPATKTEHREFLFLQANNRMYYVFAMGVPAETLKASTAEQFLDDVKKSFQKSWQLLDERKITFGQSPGREFLFKTDKPIDCFIRLKVILAGDRLYELLVRDATIADVYDPDARKFLDSFKTLP
jgi:hypothetical protein